MISFFCGSTELIFLVIFYFVKVVSPGQMNFTELEPIMPIDILKSIFDPTENETDSLYCDISNEVQDTDTKPTTQSCYKAI